MKRLELASLILILLAAMPLVAGPTATYSFNKVNDTTALGTASSYGTVKLDLDSGKITFTVTLIDGYTFQGNQSNAFGWNSNELDANRPTLTLSDPTPASIGFVGDNPGSHQFDGFGNFDYELKAGTNSASQLIFTVAKASGSFSSLDELTAPSVGGDPDRTPAYFAAHIKWGAGPTDRTTDTGYVGVTSLTQVPEPGQIAPMILMSGAIGFLVMRRRRSH